MGPLTSHVSVDDIDAWPAAPLMLHQTLACYCQLSSFTSNTLQVEGSACCSRLNPTRGVQDRAHEPPTYRAQHADVALRCNNNIKCNACSRSCGGPSALQPTRLQQLGAQYALKQLPLPSRLTLLVVLHQQLLPMAAHSCHMRPALCSAIALMHEHQQRIHQQADLYSPLLCCCRPQMQRITAAPATLVCRLPAATLRKRAHT
jgi:hypothetical protein